MGHSENFQPLANSSASQTFSAQFMFFCYDSVVLSLSRAKFAFCLAEKWLSIVSHLKGGEATKSI